MKQNYYRLTKIDKLNAQYNILLGERSNGKSYAVKEKIIIDAYKNNKKFVLLRRFDLEIKASLVEQYFKDFCGGMIEAITDKECNTVVAYRGQIYLAFYDSDLKKTEKKKPIGYYMSLSAEQHFTSGSYTDVKYIVFEEFISRDFYIKDEPTKLMQLISTIARRNEVKVYLIGNTISRLCPYFTEWNLKNIPKQKQGTIDIYEYETLQENENGEKIVIKIAVEFCENSGKNSKMFFGSASGMITNGAWQSKEYPHLIGNMRKDYETVYTCVIKCKNFKFLGYFLISKVDNFCCWYILPKTTEIKKDTRIITDVFTPQIDGILTTVRFKPLSSEESLIFDYLFDGIIVYSDNLTGSDFENCLQYFK